MAPTLGRARRRQLGAEVNSTAASEFAASFHQAYAAAVSWRDSPLVCPGATPGHFYAQALRLGLRCSGSGLSQASTPQHRRISSVMWIVTIVLLGLAALGLSGEVQQRSQRKRSRRETLLDAEAEATKVANTGGRDVG